MWHGLRSAPTFEELLCDAELIADTGHDKINQIVNADRVVIETGHRGKNHGPRIGEAFHVLQLNTAQWGFTRDNNQLAALLQVHIGCSMD